MWLRCETGPRAGRSGMMTHTRVPEALLTAHAPNRSPLAVDAEVAQLADAAGSKSPALCMWIRISFLVPALAGNQGFHAERWPGGLWQRSSKPLSGSSGISNPSFSANHSSISGGWIWSAPWLARPPTVKGHRRHPLT
jgi:hypothetical protein